ncbi:MAG: PocR ligand-binding domain-containing protein, partial [Candidatus Bipolaricaulota bacterium]|nr:PocR ligand-binding domain-containing protein [Candidatus Bipolaricaulota bacterium]
MRKHGALRSLGPDLAVPVWLLEHVLRGLMARYKLYVSLVLDIDAPNDDSSSGTGKLFITRAEARSSYCRMLRNSRLDEVRTLCPASDLRLFEICRQRAAHSSHTNARPYTCAGGLETYAVPIIEGSTNTFVGAVLAGQKRQRETYAQSLARLIRLRKQESTSALQRLGLPRMFLQYRRLRPTDARQRLQDMECCQKVAEEIAQIFTHFFQLRTSIDQRAREETVSRRIVDSLLRTRSIDEYWDCIRANLRLLRDWLECDSAAAFTWEQGGTVQLLGLEGTALRSLNGINELASSGGFTGVASGVARLEVDSDVLWARVLTGENEGLAGAIVVAWRGTPASGAGQHPIGSPLASRYAELLTLLELRYTQLCRLHALDGALSDALVAREESENLAGILSNAFISLTHQMNRPLISIRFGLSRMARHWHEWPAERRIEQLGTLSAFCQHAIVMIGGIARALRAEAGQSFAARPVPVNVREEIEALCSMMKMVAASRQLRFRVSGDCPSLVMDRDSFLFVIYNLVDNALKY